MRSFTTRVLLFALSAAALAGCSKNPVIQLPPPAAARMYVADLNNGLVVFTQPITASSTPSFTIPGAETAGVVFDSAGNLYVSNAGANTIAVYKSPVSATSVPTLVIGPITGAFDIEGLAFDSAGNLYAADEGGSQVLVLTPPFTAGVQAPAKALIGIPHGPIGVAFDRAGDMILPSLRLIGPHDLPAAFCQWRKRRCWHDNTTDGCGRRWHGHARRLDRRSSRRNVGNRQATLRDGVAGRPDYRPSFSHKSADLHVPGCSAVPRS